MPPIPARIPYMRRNNVPKGYDAAWLGIELQNVQRGIPPQTVRRITTDYTPNATDFTVAVDCTNGPVTVVLRPADQVVGLWLNIVKLDASANAVTIQGTVSGVSNPTLTAQFDAMSVQSLGDDWIQFD